MASISPRSTESKVGFHPSFTLGSLLQRRGGSKWDMKFHQKHHHVSDETPWVFQAKVFQQKIAMVGCQTAKVPREAVEAEVVESFQNEKLDYARDTPAGWSKTYSWPEKFSQWSLEERGIIRFFFKVLFSFRWTFVKLRGFFFVGQGKFCFIEGRRIFWTNFI